MSRHYNHMGTKPRDARSSMGESHMEDAIHKLKAAQQRAVAALTHFEGSRHTVVPLMFPPDVIDRANAVRGIVTPRNNTVAYDLGGVTMHLDYDGFRTPAIDASALKLQPGFTAVETFIREVGAVHRKYEEIKAVLRWLNREATPGAVRYLFPQAMKLVPQSPIWRDLQEVPTRYSQPNEIAAWTQVIKDAANTFVSMALLPEDVKARTRDRSMWLTFNPVKVHLDMTDPNRMHYMTDQIVYNF